MQILFEDWDKIKRYLIYDRKQKDTKKNIDTIKSRYRIMCRFFEGKEFTRDTFISYLEYLREKGYTTAYCNQFIKMAKHIDKMYALNEFSDFTQYPKEAKMVEVLTEEEMEALADVTLPYTRLEEETNTKYRLLIYLMYFTGARIGEILQLQWQDIRETPVPLVVYNQTKINEIRYAPIPLSMYDDLRGLPHYSGYIFTNHEGHPLDITTVSHTLKKRAIAIGLKKRVYNHLFRHSFINLMLRNGAKIHEVSRLVGHKTLETTNQHYVHLMVEELNDVLHTYHPALKRYHTLETITKRIRELCGSILDTDRFILQTTKKADHVTFHIEEIKQ